VFHEIRISALRHGVAWSTIRTAPFGVKMPMPGRRVVFFA
jgi:hypothetical protein